MDVRQIRIFLLAASLKSFTRTADQLGYTQANVSMQIRQLEEELGAPLFDRIGRHVLLTQQGEEFLPHAQRVVSSMLTAENLFREHRELRGTVRFGMVESVSEVIAQESIDAYHRAFPQVKIEFTVDSAENLKRQLLGATLDAAYLIDDSLPVNEWTLWDTVEVHILAVAAANHPLCALPTVCLRDLEGQSVIMMEQSASYSSHFDTELARQGVHINDFLHLQSPALACSLLAEGPYLAVIPEYSAGEAIQNGKLVSLPLKDFSQTEFVQLILSRNKVITPQLDGLLHITRETFYAKQGIK